MLCSIGIHKWRYLSNLTGEEVVETRKFLPEGGKPYRRNCGRGGKQQMWDYYSARALGSIVWVTRHED